LLVPREQEDQSGSYLNKSANKTDYPTLNVSRELSRISAPIAIANRANALRQFLDTPVSG
jgi:hypothetical protein